MPLPHLGCIVFGVLFGLCNALNFDTLKRQSKLEQVVSLRCALFLFIRALRRFIVLRNLDVYRLK